MGFKGTLVVDALTSQPPVGFPDHTQVVQLHDHAWSEVHPVHGPIAPQKFSKHQNTKAFWQNQDETVAAYGWYLYQDGAPLALCHWSEFKVEDMGGLNPDNTLSADGQGEYFSAKDYGYDPSSPKSEVWRIRDLVMEDHGMCSGPFFIGRDGDCAFPRDCIKAAYSLVDDL